MIFTLFISLLNLFSQVSILTIRLNAMTNIGKPMTPNKRLNNRQENLALSPALFTCWNFSKFWRSRTELCIPQRNQKYSQGWSRMDGSSELLRNWIHRWINGRIQCQILVSLSIAVHSFLTGGWKFAVRWDPERPDLVIFHQSMILHIVYSYTQIQIHRPFLTKKSPMSFASLAICTNAARSCAHVLEGGMTRGIRASPVMIVRQMVLGVPVIADTVWLQTGALVAGLIISLNLWGSKRSGLIRDPAKEIKDLQTCFNVLKESEKRCLFK